MGGWGGPRAAGGGVLGGEPATSPPDRRGDPRGPWNKPAPARLPQPKEILVLLSPDRWLLDRTAERGFPRPVTFQLTLGEFKSLPDCLREVYLPCSMV